MFGKKKISGLMAQSVYEELGAADRVALDGALEGSAELRAEMEGLSRVAGDVPRDAVAFEGDLVGSVRARIDEGESHRLPFRTVHRISIAVAFLLVLSGVGYMIAMESPVAVAPGDVAMVDSSGVPLSVVGKAVASAEGLVAARDYSNAYVTLARGLEAGAGDASELVALEMMAELAYLELRWYPEAHEVYERLRVGYPEAFGAGDDAVLRLNVLDEGRGVAGDYASLHALDAARRGGGFEDFEGVMSSYPATFVASLAADDLARSVGNFDGAVTPAAHLAALDSAYELCTSPVARAQLKVEMGHVYFRDLKDPVRAGALYEEVSDGPITVLAKLADESIAQMRGR